MAIGKSQAERNERENQRKLQEHEKIRARAEKAKTAVAQLNGDIRKLQDQLQDAVRSLGRYSDDFSIQRNLISRLEMIQRSIIMLSNQLESLKPKIYMVEDPPKPVLKRTR